MPRTYRKTRKKYSTKARPRRKRRKRALVSKVFKKKLNILISKKISSVAETKYLNPRLSEYTTLTQTSVGVDGINNRALVDITPEIVNGDDYNQREGDMIQLMSLQTRFRCMPLIKYQTHQQGDPADLVRQLSPHIKYLQCYIIQLDKTSAMTAGELDHNIKRPLENWMDTRQSADRAHRKEFKILKTFKIPIQYDTRCLLDSSVVPCEYNIVNFPKVTYYTCNLAINKKVVFNATSANKPVKFNYMLYMTWGNYFRNAYTDVDFPNLDFWKSATFKDI